MAWLKVIILKNISDRCVLEILLVCMLGILRIIYLTNTRKTYYSIKQIKFTLFVVYYICIVIITVISRDRGIQSGVEIVPFWSYMEVIYNENEFLLWEIICNIAMFVAVGILLHSMTNNISKIMFVTFLCSLSIESGQYLMQIGFFEIDDIINNLIGGICGVFLFRLFRKKYS